MSIKSGGGGRGLSENMQILLAVIVTLALCWFGIQWVRTNGDVVVTVPNVYVHTPTADPTQCVVASGKTI